MDWIFEPFKTTVQPAKCEDCDRYCNGFCWYPTGEPYKAFHELIETARAKCPLEKVA